MKTFILFSLLAVTAVNAQGARRSGMGGFPMSPVCWNGTYIYDVVCNTEVRQVEINGVMIQATASESVVKDPGDYYTYVKIDVTFKLIDTNNIFDPEAAVPVLARGINYSGSRSFVYTVSKSTPVILDRIQGTRELQGKTGFMTASVGGSEYTSFLNKIEVLVPGLTGAFVLNFSE